MNSQTCKEPSARKPTNNDTESYAMQKTEYYRKPQPVTALQWKPGTSFNEFVSLLKANFEWRNINIESAPIREPKKCLLNARATIQPTITMEYVERVGHSIETKTIGIRDGDWLVVLEGEGYIVTNEEFRNEYFAVTTKTERVAPTLEELL